MTATNTSGERGFVLLWMAIMLTMLLGATALAVEFNHLHREGARMQKAADAAALAGAVYLPDNFDSGDPNAVDTAIEIAANNGYTISAEDVTLDGDPTILKVTISQEVSNLLGGVIGFGSVTVERSARAQFSSPLAMGAPENRMGNDPELFHTEGGVVGDATGFYPNYWATIGGGYSKFQGEVKMSEECPPLLPLTGPADLCPGGGNADHDPNGWIYEIVVDGDGDVAIEIYDPAWVNDLYCGDLPGFGGRVFYENAAALDPEEIEDYPEGTGVDPDVRYEPGHDNPFCADDNRVFFESPWLEGEPAHFQNPNSFKSPPLWTTYRLYGPGATFAAAPPRDDLGCTAEFPGIGRTNHGQAVLPIHNLLTGDEPITDYIDFNAVPTGYSASDLPSFAQYFRAWFELCTVSEAGTYYLQVTSTEDLEGNPVPGHQESVTGNQFALRAYDTVAGPADDSTTEIAGWGMLRGWIGAPRDNPLGNTAEFFVLRLEPADHERRLVVSAFSLGDFTCYDGDDQTTACSGVEVTIAPPSDSNLDFFESCTYTDPTDRGPLDARPLESPPTPLDASCTIEDVGTPFDGTGSRMAPSDFEPYWSSKWVDIVVTVPEDYMCNAASRDGCWLRLQYTWTGDRRLHDAFALEAAVDGEPVRLLR